MAESHQDADQSDERTRVRNEAVVRGRRPFGWHFAQPVRDEPGHPSDGILVEDQVSHERRGREAPRLGPRQDRRSGPRNQQHDHHCRDIHDLQRVVRRLVDSPRVAPPEVDRDERGDSCRPEIDDVGRWIQWVAEIRRRLGPEANDVLTRGDARDWSGQDVVEHQRGDRQLRQRPAHRLLDDAIDAASREHGARFHIDGSHGVRKQHHTEDEP